MDEQDPSEELITLAARQWNNTWTRVIALDQIGINWIAKGALEDKTHYFRGPIMQKDGSCHIKLESIREDPTIVYWNVNEPRPVFIDAQGVQHDELPVEADTVELTGSEIVFPRDEAALLWIDYQARYKTLNKLWLEHVSHWREQNIPVEQRWGVGITMHGHAELFMAGYNGEGEQIMEFYYPVFGGPIPQVTYHEAYDKEIKA